jgi:hypothetical protein
MTVPQVISKRGGRFRPHYDLAPGRATPEQLAAQEAMVRGLLDRHAAGWGRRWGGLWRVLRAMRRLG